MFSEIEKCLWRDIQGNLQKPVSQNKEDKDDNTSYDAFDISFHGDSPAADSKSFNKCPDIYVEYIECCDVPRRVLAPEECHAGI